MKKFIFLQKINKITVILLMLGVGAGLFITAQWKTKTLRVSSPETPYVALSDTRDKLTLEQTNLKNSISSLQLKISEDQSKLKKNTQSKQKVEQLEQYKEEIGLTETKGDGVTITMDDSHKNDANIDSITHAADLRDLVNFLWGIGAKAISINNERVVMSTSIDCIVNTVLINNTKTTAPFIVNVTGDSKKISDELNNENNLKDIHDRVKNEGLIFSIQTLNNITIPSFDGSLQIKFAKIAE